MTPGAAQAPLQGRWAVTGAGGFIGAAVVRALAGRGVSLTALVAPPGEAGARPPAGVEAVWGSIEDEALLRSWLARVDGIIHLAGPPSVAASFKDPHGCVAAHTAGTAALLGAMAARGCRRLVYLSSAEVYGRPEALPVSEEAALRPRSPYGAAKVGAEALIGAEVRARGLGAAVLRPTSVYGPGQSLGGLMGDLLRQVGRGGDVTVRDPRPVRDFLYVEDLVAAVATAAAQALPGRSHTFNVSTGRGTSVAQLAEALVKAAGERGRVLSGAPADRPGEADIPRLFADPAAIHRAWGWSPQVDLAQGLGHTLNWHRAVESAR